MGSEGGRLRFGGPRPVLKGMVHGAGGGVYRIVLDDGRTVEASLRGRLKRERRTGDRVVVGDRVEVAPVDDGSFTVEAVAERVSEIVRSGPGGRRPKVVAANLERLVVLVAAAEPEPRTEQIDRLLVIAEAGGVAAVVGINKVDLPDTGTTVARLRSLYEAVGYPVLAMSAADGTGLEAFRGVVCDGSSALVGPSGVGKSTLLNAVEPGLGLRTGELSGKVRRGRHTTVASRLIRLSCGGLVADTPGFGDVGVWGVEAETLEACFPELPSLAEGCRFQDCAHLAEPDCAVRAAVEAGGMAESRYESYRVLMEEARSARPGA